MIKLDQSFEEVHTLIRSRWVLEILESVEKGNHSYGEILESIAFISQTELNRKLGMLVEKGALIKSENGIKSHYEMGELGAELHHIFHHLIDVKKKYF